MPYSDAARNEMLDALTVSHLSLHTAYDEAGGNEIAGDSPAYARQAVTFGATANGVRSSTDQQQFDVPVNTDVQFIGKWTALSGGTFKGMWPLIGPVEGESSDNTIYRRAHGLQDDDRVVFFGDTLPTGITEGLIYHVVGAATDSFQVSTTQGGAAEAITADGEAICMQCAPEKTAPAPAPQSQITIAAGDVDLDLNFIKS